MDYVPYLPQQNDVKEIKNKIYVSVSNHQFHILSAIQTFWKIFIKLCMEHRVESVNCRKRLAIKYIKKALHDMDYDLKEKLGQHNNIKRG